MPPSKLPPEFDRDRSVVSLLHAHLVFTPKYRRGVFDAALLAATEAVMSEVCADFGVTLVEPKRRRRPRTPAGRVPADRPTLPVGRLAQGRLCSGVAKGSPQPGQEVPLGKPPLVSVLLRRIGRWSTPRCTPLRTSIEQQRTPTA